MRDLKAKDIQVEIIEKLPDGEVQSLEVKGGTIYMEEKIFDMFLPTQFTRVITIDGIRYTKDVK